MWSVDDNKKLLVSLPKESHTAQALIARFKQEETVVAGDPRSNVVLAILTHLHDLFRQDLVPAAQQNAIRPFSRADRLPIELTF
eukprot:m.137315 g.137315  ORF g.137315 m.137315 type:complete len:84 (+) comp16051_c0_seq7:738-989(+)